MTDAPRFQPLKDGYRVERAGKFALCVLLLGLGAGMSGPQTFAQATTYASPTTPRLWPRGL